MQLDRPRTPPRVLMTGATGLLGEYLIRDLLDRGISVAVLVRPQRQCSARQRIESICQRWERIRGRAMARPVVLQGELLEEDWGLPSEVHRWIRENCDTLLHNAASLQFVAEDPEGEPWKSNLRGTERMLSLAEQWKIRHLHHVSTAYVCGRREGVIRESETDVGQPFGNDYEASKCAAEVMVRAARGNFETVTILRPAIITGDYRTGYTSTFHGLYAPLKIAASLLSSAPSLYVREESLVETLGLSGSEEKNFVPVDWVSEAMASILEDRRHYGQTYHLTATYRTSCQVLAEVMHETFAEHAKQLIRAKDSRPPSGNAPPGVRIDQILASFREQMEIYRAYWRDDPMFDHGNTAGALPDLPPPKIDRDAVRRLCRYALRTNFGWPRPRSKPPRVWAADLLRGGSWRDGFEIADDLPDTTPARSDAASATNLSIVGEGGGVFRLRWQPSDARPSLATGWSANASRQLTLSSGTLVRLMKGEITLTAAIERGAVVCEDARGGSGSIRGDRWLTAIECWLSERGQDTSLSGAPGAVVPR